MRMPAFWLLEQGIITREYFIGALEEEGAYAIASPDITSTALPLLRSGHMHIEYPWWGDYYSETIPPLPIIFSGELTIDGSSAPVDSMIYARVSKEGLADIWTSDWTSEVGYYILNAFAPSSDYDGATIEFWLDCKRSPTTSTYDISLAGHERELDLAF